MVDHDRIRTDEAPSGNPGGGKETVNQVTERRTKVTIQDVARAAGVSITTVSRYLNGRFSSMSAETRDRIARVIAETGYQPSRVAQALKANRTGIIGAIVVNLGYPLCVSVIRALSEAVEPHGLQLMVAESRGDAERERRALDAMRRQAVDALVVQTDGMNNALLAEWTKEKPVIWFDRGFGIAGGMDVVTNNLEASRELTLHLAQQGYRHVVYVSEPLRGIETRMDRLAGYEQACRSTGLRSEIHWVHRGQPATYEPVLEAVRSAVSDGPAAVYTANGLILQELYPRLRRLDITVPDPLGIATFDQPDWADIATPALTCVRQPTEAMGQAIARALMDADEAWPENARRIVIPSELRVSASTSLRNPD